MASFEPNPKSSPLSQTKAPEPHPLHVAAVEKEAAYEQAIRSKMNREGLTWPEAKQAVDPEAKGPAVETEDKAPDPPKAKIKVQ